jgi:hypothetical protein
MSLSYLGLLDTVLLSSVGSIITPCNLCEVLPTVTVQCDSPSFYPYSPKCVEEEFCEVHLEDSQRFAHVAFSGVRQGCCSTPTALRSKTP